MSSPLPTAPAAADAAVHTTEPRTAAGLQGVRRRVVYVTLYELIAIAVATVGLAALTGQSAAHASVASVAASVIAVVWNIVFNWAFERWESRQAVRGRSVARRKSRPARNGQ